MSVRKKVYISFYDDKNPIIYRLLCFWNINKNIDYTFLTFMISTIKLKKQKNLNLSLRFFC